MNIPVQEHDVKLFQLVKEAIPTREVVLVGAQAGACWSSTVIKVTPALTRSEWPWAYLAVAEYLDSLNWEHTMGFTTGYHRVDFE